MMNFKFSKSAKKLVTIRYKKVVYFSKKSIIIVFVVS